MTIKEIVIISGKGGTGKTTLTASLVPYLENIVIADCDVDAPDLHILLDPEIRSRENFVGLKKAVVDLSACTHCMACVDSCKFDAISDSIIINGMKCEGCGVCEYVCPSEAIAMKDTVVGTVFHADTTYGPMVHARLIPGEETSGKLVSLVRNEAKKEAEIKGLGTILIDGSPGIGCNVISSITGAEKVIIVTEPTMSGLHDLSRVFDITDRFSGKVFVVINKFNLSREMSIKIEQESKKRGSEVLLKIPFDKRMVKAITDKKIPSLAEKELFSEAGFEEFVKRIT
ncbi:MAG: ATP-binding protein [Spirochaetaceae bacterium]|nr:ATP-binding protein [Spirochaetaceae bacterium]